MAKKSNDRSNVPVVSGGATAASAESWHEAAHAVASIVCGYAVTGIDIIPQVVPGSGGQMGTAGAELCLPTLASVNGKGEEAVIRILVVLFAGYLAEKEVNASAELEMNHEQSDGYRALQFASIAIASPILQNGQWVSKVNEDRLKALWKRAENEAAALVKRFATPIKGLACLLETKRRLSRVEIEQSVRPMLS